MPVSVMPTKPKRRLQGVQQWFTSQRGVCPLSSRRWSERVLVRLFEAEYKEPDAWLKDDYRIAWLTVLHCSEGIEQPWEYAVWKYLGITYQKFQKVMAERGRYHAALEIPDYDPSLDKAEIWRQQKRRQQ